MRSHSVRTNPAGYTLMVGVIGFMAASMPTQAQNPAPPNQAKQLTVSGHAEMRVQPDTAVFAFDITTEDKAADVAAQTNADGVARISAALSAAGIGASDINRAAYTEQPLSAGLYAAPHQVYLTGFRVTSETQVTVRDLKALPAALNAVAAAGPGTMTDVAFSVSGASGVQDQAAALAVTDARQRADALAKAAGEAITDVIQITDSTVRPKPAVFQAADGSAPGLPVMDPKQTLITADVTVTFEISITAKP